MARKRNKSHSLCSKSCEHQQHRMFILPSRQRARLPSRHFPASEMYGKHLGVYIFGRKPFVRHPRGLGCTLCSFRQSCANKTVLSEAAELITGIFMSSYRLKIRSLAQLHKHTQSPSWETESTYLSTTVANYQTNLTIPQRQQLNVIFSAWANHLTFYPCPYFKEFLLWQAFTFFPPAADAPHSGPFPPPLQSGTRTPTLKNPISVKAHVAGRYQTRIAPYLSEHECSVLQRDVA